MSISTRSLARAAIAVSTIVSLGSPVAFAAKIQNAKVKVSSATSVTALAGSLALSNTQTTQVGGGLFTNQNAKTNSSTTSTNVQSINAVSGNVVVVTQQ